MILVHEQEQDRVSSIFSFLKVIHELLTSYSSSSRLFYLFFNNMFQKAVITQGISFKHTNHKSNLIGYLTIQLRSGKIRKSISVRPFGPNPRKYSMFICDNLRHAEYLNINACNKTISCFVQCAICTAISLVTADWCRHQIRKSSLVSDEMIFKVYSLSTNSFLKRANTTQQAEWEGRQMHDGLHTRNGRKLVGVLFLYFCWFFDNNISSV